MRMWTFLVLFITVVTANDYCVIVLSDSMEVYNVTDLTMAAYLPLGAGDVVGKDISGNDIQGMPIYFQSDLGTSCRNACSRTPTCAYYAYDICDDNTAGACWLKYGMSTPTEHGCRAYGVMANTVPVDLGGGNYTMNLCHTTSCGSYTNCQLCQNVGSPISQYCTGNDYGALYSKLTAPYSANIGYDMSFYGDSVLCPGNRRRESLVHVLCNQPQNKFIFLSEYSTCSYEYEAYLTSDCGFSPPVPTLNFSSQTTSTVRVTIQADSHLFNLDYPLQIQYTVRLDGNVVYTGATPTFIVDSLPQEPVYTFTVQGTYNGKASAISAGYMLTATTVLPGEQVIEDMITVLGQQVSQTSQQTQTQIDAISSRLDVDVVQVLRHADDGTVDIQQKIHGIDDYLYNISVQLYNQSNAVQQLLNQGGSSGSSVSGAGIAIGVVIGVVIGVIGALVGNKVFQRVASGVNRGYTRQSALMAPGMSLVDDEDDK